MSTATRNTKASAATDTLREEYLNILMSDPLLGTTFGGNIDRLGFPSAESIIAGISPEPAARKSTPRLAPKPATAAAPSPIEMFASVLEKVGRKAQPERIVA
jgi:hypothetical protein